MFLLPYVSCLLLSVSHAVWDPGWSAPFMLKIETTRYDADGQKCIIVRNPESLNLQHQQELVCVKPDGQMRHRVIESRGWNDIELVCQHQVAAAAAPPEVRAAFETIAEWRR